MLIEALATLSMVTPVGDTLEHQEAKNVIRYATNTFVMPLFSDNSKVTITTHRVSPLIITAKVRASGNQTTIKFDAKVRELNSKTYFVKASNLEVLK